jgi:hypothetical protein
MWVEIFAKERGDRFLKIWEGKLDVIPHIGEEISPLIPSRRGEADMNVTLIVSRVIHCVNDGSVSLLTNPDTGHIFPEFEDLETTLTI